MFETTRKVGPGEAIQCLLAGIKLTSTRGTVQRKVLKGIVLNAVLFLVLLVALLWGGWALTGLLIGETWYGAVLGWLARLLALGGILFASPVLYALGGEIILPGVRSEIFHFARQAAGAPQVEESGGVAAEVRSVAIDIRRLVRFLLFSLAALFLNLVPVLGSAVYLVVQALIAAHTMGWDVLGRHFELHGVRYGQQKQYLRRHRVMVLAVGGVATLLCLVPIAQFLFVTTNVAGAGVLSARLDGAPRRLEPPR